MHSKSYKNLHQIAIVVHLQFCKKHKIIGEWFILDILKEITTRNVIIFVDLINFYRHLD